MVLDDPYCSPLEWILPFDIFNGKGTCGLLNLCTTASLGTRSLCLGVFLGLLDLSVEAFPFHCVLSRQQSYTMSLI